MTVILKKWYSSDEAKRNFGFICRAVPDQIMAIDLLGTEERPLLRILPFATPWDHATITIKLEEFKADWSNTTLAASIYGTTFRFKVYGKLLPIALCRCDDNRHPAEKYIRSQNRDANAIADDLVEIAYSLRKLQS